MKKKKFLILFLKCFFTVIFCFSFLSISILNVSAKNIVKKESRQKINLLYKKAVSYYSQNELQKAEKVFSAILSIDPKQKAALNYINKKIPAREERLQKIAIRQRRIAAAQKLRQDRLAEKQKLAEEKAAKAKELREAKLQARRKAKEERLKAREERIQKANRLKEERIAKDNKIKEEKARKRREARLQAKQEDQRRIAAAQKLRQDRLAEKQKLAEEKAAKAKELREAKLQARQERMEDLRKSREENDYITIKSESAREIFEDANHLRSIGKYENVVPLYNYAYDIARDKSLKKEIARAKKIEQRRAKKEKKKKIDALYKKALSYYSDGRLDDAKETFEKVLSIDPDQRKAARYIDKKIPLRKRRLENIKKRQKARQGRLEKAQKAKEKKLESIKQRNSEKKRRHRNK